MSVYQYGEGREEGGCAELMNIPQFKSLNKVRIKWRRTRLRGPVTIRSGVAGEEEHRQNLFRAKTRRRRLTEAAFIGA